MADDSNINVNITANDSDAEAALARLEAQLNSFNEQVKGTAAGLSPLNSQSRVVFEQFDQGSRTLAQAQNAFQHLSEAMAANEISGTAAMRVMSGIEQSLRRAAPAATSFGLSTTQAVNGARALFDELASGRDRQATGTFARLAIAVAEVNPVAVAASVAFLAVGAALIDMAVKGEEAERTVNRLQEVLTLTGNSSVANKAAIDAMTASMTQLYGVNHEAAEEMIADFSRASGATVTQFQQMADVASRLSLTMNTTVEQSAQRVSSMMNGTLANAFNVAANSGIKLGLEEEQAAQQTERLYGTHAALAQVLDVVQGKLDDATQNGLTPLQQSSDKVSKSWDELKQSFSSGFSDDVTANWKYQLDSLVQLLDMLHGKFHQVGEDATDFADAAKSTASALPAGPSMAEYQAGTMQHLQEVQANLHAQETSQERIADVQQQITNLTNAYNASLEAGNQMSAESVTYKRELGELTQQQAQLEQSAASQSMSAWQQTLNDQKTQQGAARANDLAQDEAYWEQILNHNQLSAAQREAVERQLAQVRNQLNNESSAQEISDLQEEIAQATKGSEQKRALIQQELSVASASYGQMSQQYRSAQQAMTDFGKEQQSIRDEIAKSDAASAEELAAMDQDVELEQYKTMAAEKIITAQQLADKEIELAQKTLNAKLVALDIEEDAAGLNADQINQIENQKADVQAKFNAQIAADNARTAREEVEQQNRAADEIANSLSRQLFQVLGHNETIRQAALNLAGQLVEAEISAGMKKLAENVLVNTGIIAGNQAKNTTILTQDAAAQSTGKAQDAAMGQAQIMSDAAKAAAGAYSAVVDIPIVGPVLAPAAAGVAYAAVSAYSSLASAAGGWDMVPNDQIAQLHKNEMVLPAYLAESIRTMAKTGTNNQENAGGTGGDTHIHINAVDAQSVKRLFKSNGTAMISALKSAQRNFAT